MRYAHQYPTAINTVKSRNPKDYYPVGAGRRSFVFSYWGFLMSDRISGGITSATDRGYVDLGAIIAGSIVALGASVVLSTLGAAIGLGSFSFKEGGSTFGFILTALYIVASMVVIYTLGGYITGRLRRRVEGAYSDEVKTRDGLHGLVVWGLGTLLGAVVLTGAVTGTLRVAGNVAGTTLTATGSAVGGVAQGAGQLAGGAISGVGQLVGNVAQGAGEAVGPSLEDALPGGLTSNPVDYISGSLLRPSQNIPGPRSGETGNAEQEVGQILVQLIRTGEISEEDRGYLRQLVAAQTGVSTSEVNARVEQAEQRAQEIRAQAQERIEEAQAKIEEMRAEAQAALDEARARAEQAAEDARIAGIMTALLLTVAALIAGFAAYSGAIRGGAHRDGYRN